jgi:hypothetical protein
VQVLDCSAQDPLLFARGDDQDQRDHRARDDEGDEP